MIIVDCAIPNIFSARVMYAAAAAGTGALNYFTRAEICSSVMHKMNFVVGLYFQGMPTTGHSSDSLIPAFLAGSH